MVLLSTWALSVRAAPSAEPSDRLLEPGVELDWRSPSACDERTRTLATVARLLGASPRERASAPLRAEASVTRTASAEWQLLLVVTHGSERLSRELTAASCAELSDAVALILALVLDPELLSRADAQPEEQAPAAEAAPLAPALPAREPASSARPVEASPAAAPPRAATRLVPFIELGPVLGLGVIPSPAFGVSLSGGFDAAAWRFGLTVAFFPARRQSAPEPSAASALFELRALSAAGCFAPELARRLRVGPCLVSELGSITARGEGVDFPNEDSQPWGATGIAAMLSYATPSALELGTQASLLIPWGRTDFRLAGSTVYQPAALSLGLRGYLGVRF